jgi:folate-binding protein YgfZ
MSSHPAPDLDAQYRQLREECGLVHRQRTVITVTGPDAAEFLQGQVTNDVEQIEDGSGCYAVLLDRKGRIQADMRILRRGEGDFLIDAPVTAGQKLLRHLSMYMIGRDVEVAKADLAVISLIGPATTEVSGLATGLEFATREATVAGTDCVATITEHGLDLICPEAETDRVTRQLEADGAIQVSEDAAEILRIETGRPKLESEMGASPMPAEAGIVDRAVSFTKGCYIGQEPVARLHYKGRPNRHLRGLRLDGAASAGDPVRSAERELGSIGSSALSPASGRIALAILRREAEPGDRVIVETAEGNVEATVAELPFLEEAGL